MSLTVQQILLDSKRLATRLKEDDSAVDVLLSQTQTVYKQIDAMKQYVDEAEELNELAHQRPHSVLVAGIHQESRHLRELQQENRELRAALEDHQNALEVIMSKYRQQITTLVKVSKLDLTNLYNNQYAQIINQQSEKINEMAAVMKKAAEIDETTLTQDKEVISRLSTENQGLRDLLDISVKFGSANLNCNEKDNDGSDLDSTVVTVMSKSVAEDSADDTEEEALAKSETSTGTIKLARPSSAAAASVVTSSPDSNVIVSPRKRAGNMARSHNLNTSPNILTTIATSEPIHRIRKDFPDYK